MFKHLLLSTACVLTVTATAFASDVRDPNDDLPVEGAGTGTGTSTGVVDVTAALTSLDVNGNGDNADAGSAAPAGSPVPTQESEEVIKEEIQEGTNETGTAGSPKVGAAPAVNEDTNPVPAANVDADSAPATTE